MSVSEKGTAAAVTTLAREVSSTQSRLAFVSGFLGSTIEFYDFIIYSTAATLVFGSVFFRGMPPPVAIIASFGTLAVGYVARPVGGILFGHWGDRFSRKNSLIMTLVLTGVITILIGLLPTSAQIGALAPVLLVVLRIIQGLGLGGEWAGSVLLTVESARSNRRGLFGSATAMGSGFGFLLATAAFASLGGLSKEQLLSWGWRLPFLASVVLLGLGLWMRVKLEDTPAEKVARAEGEIVKVPVAELFRSHWRRTLLGVGIFVGPFMIYSIFSTFAITFATTYSGVSRQAMFNILIVVSAINLVLMPLYGALSDRLGRKKIFVPGVAGMLVTSFLLFPAIQSGNVWLIAAVYIVQGSLLFGAVLGTVGSLFSELFPTRVRFTGAALAYQGATLLGGGFGPLLMATIGAGGRGVFAMGLLMAGTVAVSLVCLVFLQETRQVELVSR